MEEKLARVTISPEIIMAQVITHTEVRFAGEFVYAVSFSSHREQAKDKGHSERKIAQVAAPTKPGYQEHAK